MFKELKRLWMMFADALGKVVTFVWLFIIYYLAIGVTSILLRITGRDLLQLRSSASDSYAVSPKRLTRDMAGAERQF